MASSIVVTLPPPQETRWGTETVSSQGPIRGGGCNRSDLIRISGVAGSVLLLRCVKKLPKTTVEQTQRLSEVPVNAHAGRQTVQFSSWLCPSSPLVLLRLPSCAPAAPWPPFWCKTQAEASGSWGLLRVDEPFYSSSFSLRGRQWGLVAGPALGVFFGGLCSSTGVPQTINLMVSVCVKIRLSRFCFFQFFCLCRKSVALSN